MSVSRPVLRVVLVLVLIAAPCGAAAGTAGNGELLVLEGVNLGGALPTLGDGIQAMVVDRADAAVVFAGPGSALDVAAGRVAHLGELRQARSSSTLLADAALALGRSAGDTDGLFVIEATTFTAPDEGPGAVSFSPQTTGTFAVPDTDVAAAAVIVSEDFEGALSGSQGGQWNLATTNQGYYWTTTTCDHSAGAKSGDPIRGGSSGSDICCSCTYPQGIMTYLDLRQGVNVSGADTATLSFDVRGQTLSTTDSQGALDSLGFFFSADGHTYYGYSIYGDHSGSWSTVSADMRSWYGLGDLTTRGALYFRFRFASRSQYPDYAMGYGFRVDQLRIVVTSTPPEYCGGTTEHSCSPGAYCETAIGDCGGTGTCQAFPYTCSDVYDPVCGCDGVTYSNECYAAMNNESLAYTGECQASCSPNAPGNPRVQDASSTHACSSSLGTIDGDEPALLWDAVPDAARYQVQVFGGATDCGGTAGVDTIFSSSQLGSHPGVHFSDPLQPDDYCWRVRGDYSSSGSLDGCWTDCCCFTVGQQGAFCGDGTCDWWETAWDCPADCALGTDETGRTGGKTKTGYVPAAVGGQGGVGGTFWSTEGLVYNPNDSEATVTLSFTPDSSPGTSMDSNPISLPANGVMYAANLVQELWQRSDNGCIWLSADLPVIITTRTYNQGPDGTYGQGLGSISSHFVLSAGDTAYLLGLSENAGFRTNVILQATGDQESQVKLTAFRGDGAQVGTATLTVPAHSKIQRRFLDLGFSGLSDGFAKVEVTSGGTAAVLGSVVDNVTGDATTVDVVHPDQVLFGGGAAAAPGVATTAQAHYLVAVVAHTPGVNHTLWKSKLTLMNPATSSQTVQVQYRPASGGVMSAQTTIPAGQQKTFQDVVSQLFPGAGNSTGALHVFAPTGVIVNSRTFNQGPTGTYGQSIPGLGEGDLISAGERGVLPKLSSSTDFRCNVGFTEFSGVQTQVAVTLFARSFTSLVPIASKEYVVPASKNLQINNIFQDMGISGDYTGVLAWVTVTSGGRVYAYASNVDNHTGDAEFITAKLK